MLKAQTVKQKLIMILSLVSFTSVFIACVFFLVYDRFTTRQSMESQLAVLGKVIADRSTAALVFVDPQLAQENLESLSVHAPILTACMYDDRSLLFAQYQRSPREVCAASPQLQRQTAYRFLQIQQAVLLDGSQVGTLYIRSSLEQLNVRLQVYLLVVLVVLLISSGTAVAMSIRMQRVISEPISSLTNVAGEITRHKDYSIRATTISNDAELALLVAAWNTMLSTIEQQNAELNLAKNHLEEVVEARTAELKSINHELEAFSYSVSHDLRAPLRAVDGFSVALMEDCHDQLDDFGKDYLRRIRAASQRMGDLIDDLLHLSRVSRQDMVIESVELVPMVQDIVASLEQQGQLVRAVFVLPDFLTVSGDQNLLRVVMENLVSNALKYSSKVDKPAIELGGKQNETEMIFWVKDNGAGFDMKYADKLFGPFQRLHRDDEFEGLGIGLATVARIVNRHGGRIWAESAPDEGACFYIALPQVEA